MNNSLKIDLDEGFREETTDPSQYREREAKLVKLLESYEGVANSKEWRTLKEELFDRDLNSLESRQIAEANKAEVSLPTLYRLQGQLHQAKRSNLEARALEWKVELDGIRNRTRPPQDFGGM